MERITLVSITVLFAQDVGGHGVEGGVEQAFLYFKDLFGDGVEIFAIFNSYWYCHSGCLLVEIDQYSGFLATLNKNLLTVVGDIDDFGLAEISMAELVDGTHCTDVL